MIPPKRFDILSLLLRDAQKVWARSEFSVNNVRFGVEVPSLYYYSE